MQREIIVRDDRELGHRGLGSSIFAFFAFDAQCMCTRKCSNMSIVPHKDAFDGSSLAKNAYVHYVSDSSSTPSSLAFRHICTLGAKRVFHFYGLIGSIMLSHTETRSVLQSTHEKVCNSELALITSIKLQKDAT